MRKESYQLSQSTETGNGGGGVLGLFRGSQRQTQAVAGPGSTPMSAASGNSGFTANSDSTGAKSIKWGDSKDTTVNEESMAEDELIRTSESYQALVKTIGKAKAKGLVNKKLAQMKKFENVGTVDPNLKTLKKYDIVKAVLMARGAS